MNKDKLILQKLKEPKVRDVDFRLKQTGFNEVLKLKEPQPGEGTFTEAQNWGLTVPEFLNRKAELEADLAIKLAKTPNLNRPLDAKYASPGEKKVLQDLAKKKNKSVYDSSTLAFKKQPIKKSVSYPYIDVEGISQDITRLQKLMEINREARQTVITPTKPVRKKLGGAFDTNIFYERWNTRE